MLKIKDNVDLKELEKFRFKEFILFCIVGIANTIVSYAFYRLVLLVDVSFIKSSFILIAASVIGDVAGAINSYILNSRIVFHNKSAKSMPKKFLRITNARAEATIFAAG